MRKLFSFLIVSAILALSQPMAALVHPGPLDLDGGHTDYNNVSGYGDYHYHCGDYPAHPHPRGVCVYDESQGPIIDSPPEHTARPTASTVLVNGRNIEHLEGKYTALKDSDTVSIFPMVAGG